MIESRAERLLGHRRLPVFAALLAALLCAPALFTGWLHDDWVQQAMLRGLDVALPHQRPLTHFFAFLEGDPAVTGALRDVGVMPWWTPLDLRLCFFRPVTVLTHLFDHAVAPGSPVLAHAHNLLWLALVVLLAARLFGRLLPTPAVAGLATLMYAVDESHGMPAAWVANRNALIATALGLLTVWLHLRWRRDGRIAAAFAAPVMLALALLSAEGAIATTAWLFAFAVWLDAGPRRARLLSLVPYALVVIVWRAIYSALGYGANGSGFYIDPLREPLAFVGAMLVRAPVLLADQFLTLPSTPVTFLEQPGQIAAALFALGLLLTLARFAWRRLRGDATAAFFATGLLLSVVPICAVFPANRVLWFVGFGGAGLVALLLRRLGVLLLRPTEAPTPGRGARTLGRGLAALHLGLAALLLPANALSVAWMDRTLFDPCAADIPFAPELAEQTVVLINSHELCASYARFRRAVRGQPVPGHVRLLASRFADVDVLGVDAHTIELRPAGGFHAHPADRFLRRPTDSLPLGQIIDLPGLRVTVTAVDDAGVVTAIEARFDVPLTDPSLVWRVTRNNRLEPFTPPEPGAHIRVPAVLF
ncbi:MAG: hypothetical protein KC620_10495 [Myxococcales bacterium]|nr:hypothetical protein [Myxococcales bacterium]